MPMKHTVLTFIAQVDPGKAAQLRELLQQIRDTLETNTDVPFRDLKMLHYASFVLHESHPAYGPYLVFENNFDGDLDSYLKELSLHAASGLHRIYACCKDYRVQSGDDRQGIMDYLKVRVVRPNAYHIGNTGRSVQRIIEEQKLRDALEVSADSLGKDGKLKTPGELFKALQSSASSDRNFGSLPAVGPRQSFHDWFVPYARLVGFVLLALAIVVGIGWFRFPLGLIFLVTVIVLLLLWLRYLESKDSVQLDAANSNNLAELVKNEDRRRSVQNQMASITIVKNGWLRRALLRAVLGAVNLLARAQATHGKLSGIPSIHFAHWSLIDGGRRLLFLSNFDGSWENYLDDFIDKAHHGLTAVWSNTFGFPRTYFLAWGARLTAPDLKQWPATAKP
jgi:hypothetical protein